MDLHVLLARGAKPLYAVANGKARDAASPGDAQNPPITASLVGHIPDTSQCRESNSGTSVNQCATVATGVSHQSDERRGRRKNVGGWVVSGEKKKVQLAISGLFGAGSLSCEEKKIRVTKTTRTHDMGCVGRMGRKDTSAIQS